MSQAKVDRYKEEKKNFKKFINHFCKIVRCIPERANK